MMRFSQRLALKYIRSRFALMAALSRKKAAREAFHLFCTPQYRNRKKLPPVFEKAEKLSFPFEEHTLQGYRWNKGGGRRLLILHGFESSVINFDRYIKPLTGKGYEVLAFDAPAHGRSSGRSINVLLYKKMIGAIDSTYGPVDAFLAHSLGGLALSLYMESHPHDAQTKLVLIAPAMETVRAIDNFFAFLRLNEGVRAAFDALITAMGGQPPAWYSINRAAANIRAEVLFLQDTQDEMTPMADVAPLMEKQYPNFTFRISEGLGHRRIYRDNSSFKAIIDFL